MTFRSSDLQICDSFDIYDNWEQPMPTNHSDPSILAKFLSRPDGSKASSFIRALNQKWFGWEAGSCRKYLILMSCCKYLIFVANIWIFISNIWFRREASCCKYYIFIAGRNKGCVAAQTCDERDEDPLLAMLSCWFNKKQKNRTFRAFVFKD